MQLVTTYFFFFFFNDTATTEIYTLSLHDALPISRLLVNVSKDRRLRVDVVHHDIQPAVPVEIAHGKPDRKSTRLNSSHQIISYAVFCLKKKKEQKERERHSNQPVYRNPESINTRY